MKKVLFVGDINVDILMGGLASLPIVDKEILCESFELTVGSSAVICAAAYRFLGGAAGFCGLAGKDDYGRYMLARMREFDIDTSLVMETEAVATGVTVNLIRKPTRTQITYPGTITAFDGSILNADRMKGYEHIHFAGPYQQLNFRDRITGLLKTALSLGMTTSLDPQWDMTENWEHMDEWLPLLTWFFANADEAFSITGADSAEKAWSALCKKTSCPVLKIGPAGAFAAGRAMPTYDAEVLDTTGAGDSFDAGFLYGMLEKDMDVAKAADFGNAAGARSCRFRGGVAARSSYRDILETMKGPRNECI